MTQNNHIFAWQQVIQAMLPVRHVYLIWQMAKRDILGRYKGSVLGLGWSLLYPLLLLATYTFVFRLIFKARWPGMEDHPGTFALNLFAGLLLFNLFSEVVGRAPRLVLEQPNLVKRVIFPLEVLPWVGLGSAVFHTLLSLGVLLGGVLLVQGGLPWSVLATPLIKKYLGSKVCSDPAFAALVPLLLPSPALLPLRGLSSPERGKCQAGSMSSSTHNRSTS